MKQEKSTYGYIAVLILVFLLLQISGEFANPAMAKEGVDCLVCNTPGACTTTQQGGYETCQWHYDEYGWWCSQTGAC